MIDVLQHLNFFLDYVTYLENLTAVIFDFYFEIGQNMLWSANALVSCVKMAKLAE